MTTATAAVLCGVFFEGFGRVMDLVFAVSEVAGIEL